MIENLSFIECVILLIINLVCICGLIRCAFAFRRIEKNCDIRINNLKNWIKLNQRKDSNEDC